jgi:leader peptidase (prepilin peptidase)/N-methyltransferase
MVWNIPILLLVAYATWTDIKRKEIDDWVSVAILAYGILLDGILYREKDLPKVLFLCF